MSFHVRRKEREITDPTEMRNVLKTTKYVTVALCMNNEPYLVALSHGYDEERNCIYFHCAPEGKKLVYAQANNRVWGQAVLDYGVTDECDYAYTSVHFQGTLTLLSDPVEKRHALETLVWQTSNHPEEKLAKVKPEKIAKTTMGRIDIAYMSGKKHQAPPKTPV
ncbi:MAG: pyridoxamine 5'-phosphate oxidase family protein [Candidatus Bathyarchaeia archaeon]|jgi:nitroimidazol reductase NimA-like FMN-containing flavoprotein (pyridoxamine 5'-phosphate oxidase superfamily)